MVYGERPNEKWHTTDELVRGAQTCTLRLSRAPVSRGNRTWKSYLGCIYLCARLEMHMYCVLGNFPLLRDVVGHQCAAWLVRKFWQWFLSLQGFRIIVRTASTTLSSAILNCIEFIIWTFLAPLLHLMVFLYKKFTFCCQYWAWGVRIDRNIYPQTTHW